MRFQKTKKLFVLLLAASMLIPWIPTEAAVNPKEESMEAADFGFQGEVDSPYDLFEGFFQMVNSKTGKSLSFKDGLFPVNAESAENENDWLKITRYGDLDTVDPLDNIPVSFQTLTGDYCTLVDNAEIGTNMTVWKNMETDLTQRFVLKKSPNWSKENPAYKIYQPLTHLYIGCGEEEPCTLQAYGTAAPDYDFVFLKKEESAVGKVRTLPGYELLTDHEKERVFDILGGIGAYAFNFSASGVSRIQEICNDADTSTAEEQADAIRRAMEGEIFGGQTNWYPLPALPGADGVKLEIQEETDGVYDFWRGAMLQGTRYTLVITDAYASQTIYLHVENNDVAITNGKNAMEALKQIPYPLRRNINNMYIRNDSANSYNCGAHDFFMRIDWCPSMDDVAMYMTHEFGHSLDQIYNLSDGGTWEPARSGDIMGVSSYGNSNNYEDLADFGRLYFQCYGHINMMYAIRQIYPNRYRVYVDTLLAAGYSDILMEKTDQIVEGAYKGTLKETLAKAQKKASKADVFTAQTFTELNSAVVQAQSVMDSFNVWQSDVDTALERLEKAIYGLELAEPKGKIAEFSFDDADMGFIGGNAVASNHGKAVLSDDAVKGKSLSLSGDGANYLTVAKYDGTPLLSDYNELTVSFWSKTGERTNWAFYGAPNDNANEYGREVYMGILDQGTGIIAERYKNSGVRPENALCEVSQNVWRFITVVIRKDSTTIFVDGIKKSGVGSNVLLSDILEDNSRLYIGKANWGGGEYFNGLIDEFTMYNYPMTTVQVAALYRGTEPTEDEAATAEADQKKADLAMDVIRAIGTVVYSENTKARIDAARKAYDTLSDRQAALVEPEILDLLTSAETAYKEAENSFKAISNRRIAHFTFDDEETGFKSEYAKADNKGVPVLTEDAKKGKALSLDGSNDNYLKVMALDGKSLLTAYDEITVCYWGKVSSRQGSNWGFFAAPNNSAAEYLYETYMAISDTGGKIIAERFKNEGERPLSLEGDVAADEWRFITVVIARDRTTLYVNAHKINEVSSEYLLSDILQDNSICYIGRGNWSVGEYFAGLIDEFSIYNYALNSEQVMEAYEEFDKEGDESGGDGNPGENGNPGEDGNPGENGNPGEDEDPGANENPGKEQNAAGPQMNGDAITKVLETNNPGLPKNGKEESVKSNYTDLIAYVSKTSKTSNTIKWKKVKSADGYIVFGNRCNSGGKKYKYQAIKTITTNKTTKYTHKKLKRGTFYKYIVQAYKMVKGKPKIIATSKTMHSVTAGSKYGNVTSLKLNKSKVKLKVNKTFKMKVNEIRNNKKYKQHRKISYQSSNTKVATVSSKGIVKARKKGVCYIYVYAQNGIYRRVKIIVNK